MRLRLGGTWRKRWRYVAAFSDELIVCAARARVGPVGETFWLVWDRESHRMHEHTRRLLPGARGEVWTEVADPDAGAIDHAPDEGSLVRVEGRDGESAVRAFLRVGSGRWVETVCPTEAGQYTWTRKRADVPVECDVRVGEARWRLQARGVEDESAGYHPHHTVWSWSAGVGTTEDGRSVGWNLVTGLNDPPELSERAIWVDGEPAEEPAPVRFDDLGSVSFEDGSRLDFSSEGERTREHSRGLFRSSYRQPFGAFTGSLPGGLQLATGVGVMEHHDAHW
jgi:hypothetical protein